MKKLVKAQKGVMVKKPKILLAPKGPQDNPFKSDTTKVKKKYEVGGVTESESCGKPGKPRCRQKFKSKGKSTETKGSVLGTIGAGLLGGLGYLGYKKLKEQKKGGATKYQRGGETNPNAKPKRPQIPSNKPVYKTGGVVNPNAKAQADKTPGSKGVKSGVNPKAVASKVARGRVGGISTAPKKATPGKK